MPQQGEGIDLGVNRPEDARAANDRIARSAERHKVVGRLPMLCECSDRGCRCLLLISPSAYWKVRAESRDYLTLPGHALDSAEPQAKAIELLDPAAAPLERGSPVGRCSPGRA